MVAQRLLEMRNSIFIKSKLEQVFGTNFDKAKADKTQQNCKSQGLNFQFKKSKQASLVVKVIYR